MSGCEKLRLQVRGAARFVWHLLDHEREREDGGCFEILGRLQVDDWRAGRSGVATRHIAERQSSGIQHLGSADDRGFRFACD